MQKDRRRIDTQALADFAELPEAEAALVIANVTRIDFHHRVACRVMLAAIVKRRAEQVAQQITRAEIRVNRQPRNLADNALRSPQAFEDVGIVRIGEQAVR